MLKLLLLSLFFVWAAAAPQKTSRNSLYDSSSQFRRQLESCNLCPKSYQGDPSCNGFKIKDNNFWDDYPQEKDGMDDTSDCEFNCCAESEGQCCKDYPVGYYIAFAIGIGGVLAIALFVIYKCYCAGGDEAPPVKAEEEE